MKKLKTVSILLSFALILGSSNVFAQSLSEAEKKKEEIQHSLDEANALVASLEDKKKTKEEKIETISKEIQGLEKEAKAAEGEIENINKDIDVINSDIDKAKVEVETRASDMALRIIYSYENGRNNLMNALFSSKSLSEILNVIQYSIDIAKYDKEVMEGYEQALQVLSQQTDALKKKQEDAQRLVAENDERIEAISVLKSAQEGELLGIEGELTDAAEIAKVYELEMQAQNEVLSAIQSAIAAEKEEARRKQEALLQQQQQQQQQQQADQGQQENNSGEDAQNQGTGDVDAPINNTPEIPPSTNTSGFIWPCPASHRITSEFGPRESPTAGASTNHKGIDIGAPTGSDIVAAQDGKVILSQFSNSAGNYVIISHGVNSAGKLVCTVYMHASQRLVSVGNEVKKGQVIAKVGSTGYSTGPHLHFGVSEDGTYVNPWNYL